MVYGVRYSQTRKEVANFGPYAYATGVSTHCVDQSPNGVT
jgi:hypothetical protein